ncbi:hyphally regulated cell wall protein 1-like [Lytechinus variegatus]|uniref:hyphally regulated cell wall protein 1-like n=1 Tax=Lytechinus variegatus TaxID=7654 RepID=UPI001BB1185E|nr:hyphally regulated cell wall protein 1-like [Lytechinus variegatus]
MPLFRELLVVLLAFTTVALGQMIGQDDRSHKAAGNSLLKKYFGYATNKEYLKKEISSFFHPKPFYSKNSINDYGGNGMNDFNYKPSSSKSKETLPIPQFTGNGLNDFKYNPYSSKSIQTSSVPQFTHNSVTRKSSTTPSSEVKETTIVPESTPIQSVTEQPSSPPLSSPCQTPAQWEGKATEWDHIKGVKNHFHITFDGINRSKRILVDKHAKILGKSIYEYIMLYDEGIQYVINHDNNTCTVEQLGTWSNFTIPSNATLEESYEIAGSGVMVQEWSDRIPGKQKESWIGTFTYPGCLPVKEIVMEKDEHHTTVHSVSTKFIGIRIGITNISVFTPPSFCKKATSPVKDTDQTNVDTSEEESGDKVLERSGDGSGEWSGDGLSGEGSAGGSFESASEDMSGEGSGDEVLEWSGDGLSGEGSGGNSFEWVSEDMSGEGSGDEVLEWSGDRSGEWSGDGLSGEGSGGGSFEWASKDMSEGSGDGSGEWSGDWSGEGSGE